MASSQQFFAWFENIELLVEEEQEAAFRSYAALLQEYSRRCGAVVGSVERAVAFLGDLETQYTAVSTKTTALHDACEQLLQDQRALVEFGESLSTRLGYFTALEKLTQKLNSPTLSVLSEQFVPLLNRMDECIEFIAEHPQYKDSPTYLARFRQLQSRGMTLVKLHVINSLKMATQHVLTQIQVRCRAGRRGGGTTVPTHTLLLVVVFVFLGHRSRRGLIHPLLRQVPTALGPHQGADGRD